MKTSGVLILATASIASIAIASVSLAYNVSRMHQLEQRLQVAETEIQSRPQPLTDPAITARIRDLDERLRQMESSARVQPATSSDVVVLEQRIQKVEQKITPHLEPLQPYSPAK